MLAVSAALTLTAAAAPALGAPSTSSTTPSRGAGQSILTLLDLALAGHAAQLGSISAVASDAGSRVAQLVVTPATLDGTDYGRQEVTPASAPATVDGSAKSISIPSVLDATGPTFAVDAKAGPTTVLTSAVLKALGQVTLKPAGLVSLPIDLTAATLDDVAKVTSTEAEASKSVAIGTLSLPSVNTLLTSLGVNLPALLQQLTQQALSTLGALVGDQGLATLNSTIDAAQAKVQNASDTLAGASAQLTTAQAAMTTAQGAVTSATTNLAAANKAFSDAVSAIPSAQLALVPGVTSPLTLAEWNTLSGATQTAVDALTSADLSALAAAVPTAQTALDAANAALAAAQAVVANIQALIDALQALVTSVLNAVTGDGDPLAALGGITVTTKAVATTTSTPTPVAEAKVASLKILGADAVPSQLTSALDTVTGTLAGVLNSVAGVTFTPPSVAIGTGKTSTTTSGTTRQATASITGLTVTLPSLQLPASLSTLTGSIDGFATLANGVASVQGGRLAVATLGETATMTPGSTTTSNPSNPSTPTSTHNASTPTSNPSSPSLAETGLTRGVPLMAALLILAALAVAHRRRGAGDLEV